MLHLAISKDDGNSWEKVAVAGLALFTTLFCSQNTVQLMTPKY
jgi:hypothetical protein